MIQFKAELIAERSLCPKVCILAIDGKHSRQYPTEISVVSQDWDSDAEKVRDSHPQVASCNLVIEQMIKKMEGFQVQALLSGDKLSLEDLDSHVRQMLSPIFVEFIEESIENDHQSKSGTIQNWRDTLQKLRQFNSTVRIKKVDYDFIERFDQWLRSRGLSQNTIHKHHRHVKKFLNLAIKKQYLTRGNYPYSEFRISMERVERPSLLLEELKTLERIDRDAMPDSTYNTVLDMFLLSCYTGLRVSDIMRLGPQHIEETDKGYILRIITQKANKRAQLPLYLMFPAESGWSKPEAIINKYLGEGTLFFSGISTRMISYRLSVISRFLEMKKHLTFHMGRHTFGTIMAVKVPLPVLQRLMQHSSIQTTMVYVNMNKELIDKTLEEVEW